MKRLQFTTDINAPREKVWDALWQDQNYRKWTSVFAPTSYYITDWKEGGKIQFLSGDGTGMYSTIEKMQRPDFMFFKHIGEMKEGKEQPLNESTKSWTGSMENYTLKEANSVTTLSVDIDVTDDHVESFANIFPKALQLVKELAEAK
ncbi:MAG: hypothetical protein K0S33_1518 [Bacteroidetes bacterium]|jgi:hypothetical protein|nr:hypothetical protein [Bacteroidota bacterium]